MNKPKCPECKEEECVRETYHECPSCQCGKIYYCKDCWIEFDEKGEEL